LLGLVTPVVMGLLAKQKNTQGLDASGLASLLGEQKSFLSRLLPSGIGDALGLSSLTGAARDFGRAAAGSAYEAGRSVYDTGRAVAGTAYDTSRVVASAAGHAGYEAAHQGTSIFRKILPLLLLAVLGLVAWGIWNSRTREDVTHAATSQIDTVKRQVTGALDDATEALASIRDEATARAALPQLEAASRSVTALTGDLQAMPQAVRDGASQVVRSVQPNLQSLADKAMAIPGVRSILEPVLKPLMDGLARLRG
jgi:hypothetical protein